MLFELAWPAVHTTAIHEIAHSRHTRDAAQPSCASCRTGTWIGVVAAILVALVVSIVLNVYCFVHLKHAGRPGQQQGILKFADDPFDFE